MEPASDKQFTCWPWLTTLMFASMPHRFWGIAFNLNTSPPSVTPGCVGNIADLVPYQNPTREEPWCFCHPQLWHCGTSFWVAEVEVKIHQPKSFLSKKKKKPNICEILLGQTDWKPDPSLGLPKSTSKRCKAITFFLSEHAWSPLCMDSGADGILQWGICTPPKCRAIAETKGFVCNQDSFHDNCDL